MAKVSRALRESYALWILLLILLPEPRFDKSFVLPTYHSTVWHGILRGPSNFAGRTTVLLCRYSGYYLQYCGRLLPAARTRHHIQLCMHHRRIQYAWLLLSSHRSLCWYVSSNWCLCEQLGCNDCLSNIKHRW
jgi:hypothetical protein